MAFFIGMEYISLRVQAKGLVQEPLALFGVGTLIFAVGLVAAAGESFSVPQADGKAKLLRLGGMDVEKYGLSPDYLPLPAVGDGNQVQPAADETGILFRQQRMRRPVEKRDQLLMGIDIRLALIFSLSHILADHAYHPDDAKQMVDVPMRYENILYRLPVDPYPFQLS